MPDDITPGELGRRLEAHEQRTMAEHRAMDERITELARRMVTDALYQVDKASTVEMARRLERDRVDDVRKVREDVIKPLIDRVATLEKRPSMSFGKWMQALGLVVAFLAVLLTAWAATKGAK